MSHLLIRCDASPATGVGHLMRSLAVAEAAHARGWTVSISGDIVGGWAERRIANAGISMISALNSPVDLCGRAVAIGANVVHVDCYDDLGGPQALLAEARRRRVVLSNMEDFEFGGRDTDIAVNPNIGAVRVGSHEASVRLYGPEYAPIRQDVLDAREARPRRETSAERALRCVVVMGGTDPFSAVPGVVEMMSRAATHQMDVCVITPEEAVLRRRFGARLGDLRLTFSRPTPDLAALLVDADLVVSAAGTTILELCCIGVPSAIVRVVDNQRRGYEAAVARGVAVGLGAINEVGPGAEESLRVLLADEAWRMRLATTGRAVVDGHGGARLIDRMTGVLGT